MSKYMINGHEIEIEGDRLTAGELKKQLGSSATHAVVVMLADGSEHHLQDHEAIPSNATDLSVLPAFRYGHAVDRR